jgi:hypothetical protein
VAAGDADDDSDAAGGEAATASDGVALGAGGTSAGAISTFAGEGGTSRGLGVVHEAIVAAVTANARRGVCIS